MEIKQLISEMIDRKLITESFKRGDVISVPGDHDTTHKAVVISSERAVYLEDDGTVEDVPLDALKKSTKAKRVTAGEKRLAAEYLKNMKENVSEAKKTKDDWWNEYEKLQDLLDKEVEAGRNPKNSRYFLKSKMIFDKHLRESGDIVNFSMYAGMYSDGARATFTGKDGSFHTLSASGGRPRKYYIDGKEVSWDDAQRMVGKQKLYPRQGMKEDFKLTEKVELDHSRYLRAHGKKARGNGTWMFSSKDTGEPTQDEIVTVRGSLSTAAKEAAKKLGTNRVYVMESTEINEADGWIALYNGKRLEITKSDAKDLYSAKMFAAKELKVPKSKMGLLAIAPAYNESTLNESILKKTELEKAVQVLLGHKNGVKITSVKGTTFEGTIDPKETGPLSVIYDSVTFKGRVEKAPNDSDNYIVWDVQLSWTHTDGGRNGYRVREAVGIFDGKITPRLTQDKLVSLSTKYGW